MSGTRRGCTRCVARGSGISGRGRAVPLQGPRFPVRVDIDHRQHVQQARETTQIESGVRVGLLRSDTRGAEDQLQALQQEDLIYFLEVQI